MIQWIDLQFYNDETKEWYVNSSQIPFGSYLSDKAQLMAQRLKNNRESSYSESSTETYSGANGLPLFPYQNAGVVHLKAHKRSLLADDQGLGNTIQICQLIALEAPYRTLIVCPSSLKSNWKSEILEWANVTEVQILEGRTAKVDPYAKIVIINYDIAHYVLGSLLDYKWDLIAIDEAHYLKNPDAKRTKAIMSITQTCERVVPMTGTPMPNKPIELWSMLSGIFLAYLPKSLRNKQAFGKRYCAGFLETLYIHGRVKKIWNFDGQSNLEELNGLLRERLMIRRLKHEVLPQLPSRTISVIDFNTPSRIKRLLKTIDSDIEQDVVDAINSGSRLPPLEEIASLRKEIALSKVPESIEYVKMLLANTDKVIVFAHHKDVIDQLQEGLKEFYPSVITGSTPSNLRSDLVDDFHHNSACRVIIGNLNAMGVGLTLTAASTVVFIESSWTPSINEQCIDRAHRIGQESAVNAHYIVLGGTLDARILITALNKQKLTDIVMK